MKVHLYVKAVENVEIYLFITKQPEPAFSVSQIVNCILESYSTCIKFREGTQQIKHGI